jgi:hypothetical protein|tara:strand:+ start:347 stop:898 length:552 start_codon:yes stop_codon:yes gene_type:complete
MSDSDSQPHDTEDRAWWWKHGETLEAAFVEFGQDWLDLDIQINPGKSTTPTLPDLLVDGKIADLKTQETPFFTSHACGLDPRYTVTLNLKDVRYYRESYPDIVLYFWVNWRKLKWRDCEVAYLGGVYRVSLTSILTLIATGAPTHYYARRKTLAERNATESYMFDIRSFERLFHTTDPAFFVS